MDVYYDSIHCKLTGDVPPRKKHFSSLIYYIPGQIFHLAHSEL